MQPEQRDAAFLRDVRQTDGWRAQNLFGRALT